MGADVASPGEGKKKVRNGGREEEVGREVASPGEGRRNDDGGEEPRRSLRSPGKKALNKSPGKTTIDLT